MCVLSLMKLQETVSSGKLSVLSEPGGQQAVGMVAGGDDQFTFTYDLLQEAGQ